jgi:hypothetical protein
MMRHDFMSCSNDIPSTHTSTSKSFIVCVFTRIACARLSQHNQLTGTNEHQYSRVMHYCAIGPAEQCGAHTIASQYTKKLMYMGRKRVCMVSLVIVRKNYSIFHNRTAPRASEGEVLYSKRRRVIREEKKSRHDSFNKDYYGFMDRSCIVKTHGACLTCWRERE